MFMAGALAAPAQGVTREVARGARIRLAETPRSPGQAKLPHSGTRVNEPLNLFAGR
jgi:hypothetical protein